MNRIGPGLIALFVLASPAVGQQSPDGLEKEREKRTFSTRTAGMSWYSPRAARWGRITDRHVYLFGFGRERELGFSGPATLILTSEIPIALVQRVPGRRRYCYIVDGNCLPDQGAKYALGVGIMPVGFKLALQHSETARLITSAAAGTIVFNSDMPVARSRKRNFALEAGVGIESQTSGGRMLTLGYKFHHLSNAGTGEANPGLDANVVYLSITRPRAARR